MTDKIVVLVTTNGMREARKIARELVEGKLAACVSLVPVMQSIYEWEGKLTQERESLMIIKTTRARFEEVRACVERLHSYSVPEVIALPIIDGAANYLSWVAEASGEKS